MFSPKNINSYLITNFNTKTMKRNLLFICLIVLSSITLTAQTKKEKKAAAKEKGYENIKTMIDSGIYFFEAGWATTEKGRRISLSSNPNHLVIDKDSADIDLPYFGVSQNLTAGLSGNGEISFKESIKNYKVEYNDKKEKAVIKFNANGFDISLQVTSSGTSYLNVNSMDRNSISYDGETFPLDAKK